MRWLRWETGRQKGGYRKLLLAESPWPVPFDLYLLHFPEGSSVPWHLDVVPGARHYRLNIFLRHAKSGGHFVREGVVSGRKRFEFFRPDEMRHCVTKVLEGSRWVLSLGWVIR